MHEVVDRISLELARRVEIRLRADPSLLGVARENLNFWKKRNADSPSLLRCYEEWEDVLALGLEDVCTALCAETDEGQRLRQNSPFAGVLSPAEVWKIKKAFRQSEEARA